MDTRMKVFGIKVKFNILYYFNKLIKAALAFSIYKGQCQSHKPKAYLKALLSWTILIHSCSLTDPFALVYVQKLRRERKHRKGPTEIQIHCYLRMCCHLAQTVVWM